MKLLFCGAAVFLACVGAARGGVTNLAAIADTYIMLGSADFNAGAHTDFVAGQTVHEGARRGLIQFDLAAVTPPLVITSAVITISALKGTAAVGFDLLAVMGSWGEGAQAANNGAPAAAGECTWNSRHHGVDPWGNPGGDFDPTALASTVVNGLGSFVWSGPGLLAAVQNWATNPAANHGVILRCQDELAARTAYRFGAREGGAAAILTVGFDLPPSIPPPAFTRLDVSPTNAVLTWTNNPASQYDVLYARALAGAQDWRLAEPNIPADPSGANVWTEPPALASPLYATNTLYALSERPASPTSLVLRLETVASNLVSPVVATHAGDGSGRLFVCEQRGQILILDAATNLLAPPFLDITGLVTNLSPGYDERGLLGLAFHPAYATNLRFYVYYSAPKFVAGVINHESIVAEYLATPTNANLADPSSARIVLRFDQPQGNHNGGSLAFGPDGYLYISTGDGGGAGDVHGTIGNGQNISNLLGKILRIDVDGGTPYAIPADNPFASGPGADEIFAYGFRNPWKVIFEGANLWVADVGQNLWEEINLVRKGGNYGWRIIEGHHVFSNGLSIADAAGVDIAMLDYPIHEYRHGPLGISIIGGAVYRGAGFPALTNKYVFGDFSTGFGVADGALYYLDETRPGIWERFSFYLWPTNGRLRRYVKAFGVDEAGEMYLLSTTNLGPSGLSGDLRKLLPAP